MSGAERCADAILKAAGTGLRHYTMPSTRASIILAAEQSIAAAVKAERWKWITQLDDADCEAFSIAVQKAECQP